MTVACHLRMATNDIFGDIARFVIVWGDSKASAKAPMSVTYQIAVSAGKGAVGMISE